MTRRRSLLLVGAALALAIGATPASAAQPSSSFTGNWTSTDTDGSHQTLTVSSGATPRVVFQDFYARGCDGAGVPTTHWTSAGTGWVEEDTLYVEFHKSGCGRFLQGGYFDMWFYDGATDTLEDPWGVIWYRA